MASKVAPKSSNPVPSKSLHNIMGGSWIKANIKYRVCNCYKEVPPLKPALKSSFKQKVDIATEKRCQCGYLKEEHDPQALNKNSRASMNSSPVWNYYEDTETRVTDAYGPIVFPSIVSGEAPKHARYVRIDPNTSYKDIVGLIKDAWKIPHPQMILSVLGNDKTISLPSRSIQTLKHALMRIAAQSRSWIVTNGVDTGVGQMVGQGYAEYYADRGAHSGSKFPLLGVCTYGMLANMSELEEATEEGRPARFSPVTVDATSQPAPSPAEEECQLQLDLNHNIFLMSDNGTYRKPDQEMELRLKMVDAISKYSPTLTEEGKRSDRRTDFNTRRVPVLHIVIGGNYAVFHAVAISLQYKMPCLLVRNSGGAADYLDAIIRKLPSKKINIEDEEARSTLIRKLFTECASNPFLRKMKATLKAEALRDFMELTLDIVQSKQLLSFLDLSGNASTSSAEIEDQILENVMTGKMSPYNRVNLALNLDKDASSPIMKDAFQKLDQDEIANLMTTATLTDRPKFIVNFVKYSGASLTNFLTSNRLLQMYRKSSPDSVFSRVYLFEMGSEVDTALTPSLSLFLARLLNSSYEVDIWNNNPAIGPERHLFLFSLLLLKPKSMEHYWNEAVGGSGAALLACRYLRAIAEHPILDDEPEEQKKYLKLADLYEEKAIRTVQACANDNEIRTLKLLTYKQSVWFNNDLIEVADQSDSNKFIACDEVQEVLDWKWLGRMSAMNSKFMVYLAMWLPFLILLLKYEADPEASEKEGSAANDEDGVVSRPKRKRVKWYKKIFHFYTSPFVKMLSYYTSFLIFVVLFGYVILYEQQTEEYMFYPFKIDEDGNLAEFIVMIYVVTLAIEEIRQMCSSSSDPVWKNLATYFGSLWNWIDVVAILLFLPGMVLRWSFYDGHNPEGYADLQVAARSLYILSFLFFLFRMVHCLSLSETIGSKILMLSKMTGDLVFFVVCLVVFMFSFGTAINAFLYPEMGRTLGNSNFASKVIRSIVDHTYWPLFGEVYVVASEMGIPNGDCDPDTNPYGKCQDSFAYEFLATCVYAIYIFLTNIVLVNLLVAMMVYSFNRVQKDADEEYKVEKFRFQKEFYNKPTIPNPLSFLVLFYRLVRHFYHKQTGKYPKVSNAIYAWERQNKRDMLVKRESDKVAAASTANRVTRLEARVNYLVSKVEGNETSQANQLSVMETLETIQKSLNDMSLLITTITPPNVAQSNAGNKKANQRFAKALNNIQMRVTGQSSSSDEEAETSGVYSADHESSVKERPRSRPGSRKSLSRPSSARQYREMGVQRTPRPFADTGVGRTPQPLTEESQLSSSGDDERDFDHSMSRSRHPASIPMNITPRPEPHIANQGVARNTSFMYAAELDENGYPVLVPVKVNEGQERLSQPQPEVAKKLQSYGEVETQTDDEGATALNSNSEAESAVSRQEALLEKLLENQDQTNESMKERMLEAQEQLTKLMSQLNVNSETKQELDTRLKKLDDRLEVALSTLERYSADTEQPKGSMDLNQKPSESTPQRQQERPPSTRVAARERSSSRKREQRRGQDRRSDLEEESASQSYRSERKRRPERVEGGYKATYEDYREPAAALERSSSSSRRNIAPREDVPMQQSTADVPGVFQNVEYERQSMISQIPEQSSLHSQPRSSRSERSSRKNKETPGRTVDSQSRNRDVDVDRQPSQARNPQPMRQFDDEESERPRTTESSHVERRSFRDASEGRKVGERTSTFDRQRRGDEGSVRSSQVDEDSDRFASEQSEYEEEDNDRRANLRESVFLYVPVSKYQ